jgi:hypothetical protein
MSKSEGGDDGDPESRDNITRRHARRSLGAGLAVGRSYTEP